MQVGSIGFVVRFEMGPVNELLEMVLSLQMWYFPIVVSLFKLKGINCFHIVRATMSCF
ncbi:hypothetical protein Hanom_Chr08g00710441 [Helianthus anomalus]